MVKEVGDIGGHVFYVLGEMWSVWGVDKGLYPSFQGGGPVCYVRGVIGGQGVFDVILLGLCEVLQGVNNTPGLLFLLSSLCHEA